MTETAETMDNAVKAMADSSSKVGGSGNGAARRPAAVANVPRAGVHKALELATPVKRSPRQSLAVNQLAEATPQQVIPLDDEDFKDF